MVSQKPGSSSNDRRRPRTHFADFQKYRCGTRSRTGPQCSALSGSPSNSHVSPARAAVLGAQRFAVELPREPGAVIEQVVEREVSGVTAVGVGQRVVGGGV